MKTIEEAMKRGEKSLNEFDAKRVLEAYSIPVTREKVAHSCEKAKEFASEIGYPVVLKGCSSTMTHKTEMNLVILNVQDGVALEDAYQKIEKRGGLELDGVLVQEMISGQREFVAGLIRDPQFGPCVMFGLGGIFTEALKDVTFRVAPLTQWDALEMMEEIRSKKLLGPFRGKPAVDRELFADVLVNLGRIGIECDEIAEIDINPLIIRENGHQNATPVAVDALIVLKQ